MALTGVSINWVTRVISVPRNGLDLVQLTPTEIRNLNLDEFRRFLKNLEDDVEGMPHDRTHNHNTEVLLGGITYARIIEIINGYTVTFEDGQYAVNLVGANSNIGDITNVNQVSIRSQNSAGLISNQAIEFSSFANAVTIDTGNLTGLAVAGTVFPTGTRQAPSNNLGDLSLIANRRGITRVNVIGNLVISGSSPSWDRFEFVGESPTKSEINILPSANVTNSEFYNAIITGTLDGNSQIEKSVIKELHYVDGTIFNCAIGPTPIYLTSGATANILQSYSTVPGTSTPSINMGGTGVLALRGYNGGMLLYNYGGIGSHSIDLDSGQIKLGSSFSGGTLVARGTGKLIEEDTGNHIESGIWNSGATWSGVTIINELLNVTNIANAITGGTTTCDSDEIALTVWNFLTSSGNTDGSFGVLLKELIDKSDTAQHILNVQTEMLKNKPNNC
jgi:hypothetical protein